MKYGRLVEAAALETRHPFKRPLLRLEPGAVFRARPARQWYGRLVEGIHPERAEVAQYALAFAVPCVVAGGEAP
jgi:CRISPR-associated protein Csm4